MEANKPQGHPRHQVREFTVTITQGKDLPIDLKVTAQTREDAILRAGVRFGTEHPDITGAGWIVVGVYDPAPAVWSPSEN